MTDIPMDNMATKDGVTGQENPAFAGDGHSPAQVSVTVDDSNKPRHRFVEAPAHDVNNGGSNYDVNVYANVDADDSSKRLNPCARAVEVAQKAVISFLVANKKWIIRIILLLLLALYLAYFIYCMYYRFGDEGSIRLLACTIFGMLLLALHFSWDHISKALKVVTPDGNSPGAKNFRKVLPWVLYGVSLVAMVTLLIVLVALDTPSNLISLAGLAAFIVFSWITSSNPARVNWHPVFWGFSLQFYFACIILKTQWGYDSFKWLGDRVTEFLNYANEGAAFVFGPNPLSEHFFAFALMPVIVFFSAAISVLYYLGVMQALVSVIGRFLAFCLGTTPAESINAAGNIFVGQTEAPLMIRPFLGQMTKSELHAVMTGGFATIAGTVLGAYIGFGVPANHLLSASVMSAPAALAVSKLTYPETEETITSSEDWKIEKGAESNIIEAASAGASNAIMLVSNIVVNVIAFLSILKFINATLTWFGDRAGVEGLTFQFICSYVLYPVALFMGTEPGLDCRRIGELVGVKTFTNEFIAYQDLRKLLVNRETYTNYSMHFDVNDPAFVAYDDMDVKLVEWNVTLTKGFLSPRSEVIATYALCGFSNVGSMGIMLGALSAMAPHRRQDMASIVVRAMIAGNIACFFTACIAGLFYEEVIG